MADAGVDLVAADGRRAGQREHAADIAQLLVRFERRRQIEQAEALAVAGLAFKRERIGDGVAEHLQATADAEHATAVAQMALQIRLPAPSAQPR